MLEGAMRMSLVQPPVPSGISCGTRPGCLVLFPFGFWKLQGRDCTASLGNLHSCLGVTHADHSGWKSFFLCLVWTSLVSAHACCLSSSQCGTLCRAQLHLLPSLPAGSCWHLLGCTFGSCSACCPPQPPQPFLWSCSPCSQSQPVPFQ